MAQKLLNFSSVVDSSTLVAARAAAANTNADDADKQQGSSDTWWLILAWILFVLWVIGLILMSVNNYFLHMIARNSSTKYGSTPNPGWNDAIDYYESWTPSQRGRMQTVAAFGNGMWMLPGVNLVLHGWLMGFLAPVHAKVRSDPKNYKFDEVAARQLVARGATPAQIETAELAASNEAAARVGAARSPVPPGVRTAFPPSRPPAPEPTQPIVGYPAQPMRFGWNIPSTGRNAN